ncbi:hypothetical protein F4861DRAFT_107268 [Xylaria intraflava]|nr:hypothetical protein F4861DRAFT_107268 [Xylaria intraflava]
MRLSFAISGLWACSLGLSTACNIVLLDNGTGTATDANSVVLFSQWPLTTRNRGNYSTFVFEADGVAVNTVRLKSYNETASDGRDDVLIAQLTIVETATDTIPPFNANASDTPTKMLPSDKREFRSHEDRPLRQGNDASSVDLLWRSILDRSDVSQPLYLECLWSNQTLSGMSTTWLFTAQCEGLVERQEMSNATIYPARQEYTSTSEAVPPAPGTTSPVAAPTGAAPPSSSAHSGLSRADIIGIAVGASVGGLLILAFLVWFFYTHFRRRENPTHHIMPSYASNIGALAMTDKGIPVTVEPSPPESGHGDGEQQPGINSHVRYSDHVAAAPAPLHTPAEASPAASQTDFSSTRGAPTPTPAIASRYAHLVEEDMSEEEIRRLEEEERQLDAAIEHAGRRRSQLT